MTESTLSTVPPTPAKDVDALLAYIGPLFIWTMMKHGDNPSYVWHAKNSAGIFVVDLGLVIAIQILWMVVPVGLYSIFGLIVLVLRIAMGLMSIYALWQTWNGKQAVLPFVTGIGQKVPLEKWFSKKEMSAAPAATPAASPAPSPAPTPVAAAPAPMAEATPAPVAAPAPAPEPMKAPEPAPMSEPAPTPAPSPAPVAEAPASPAAPEASVPPANPTV